MSLDLQGCRHHRGKLEGHLIDKLFGISSLSEAPFELIGQASLLVDIQSMFACEVANLAQHRFTCFDLDYHGLLAVITEPGHGNTFDESAR